MDIKIIANITVKEIFEKMVGEENANAVLSKIQAEYEKGVIGEQLADFAKTEIQKYYNRLDLPIPIALIIFPLETPEMMK